MKVMINGKSEVLSEGLKMEELVVKCRLNLANVAIELNERILKKNEWPETVIKENDVIELISFVGGG